MYYILLIYSFLLALIIVGDTFSNSLNGGSSKSDIKVWNNSAPIPLNRIEVAVDTAYEQKSLSVDAQQGDKPHELKVSSDLEYAYKTSSDLQTPATAATVRRSRLL